MSRENKYRKALKNYTTKVPVNRTINEIEQILLQFGATGIGHEYDKEGRIKTINFKINIYEREQRIQIPFRIEKVIEVLVSQKQYRDDDHAYRVAIRNVKDLLDSQLAFLATDMVSFEELMLPFFCTVDGRTIYEVLEENQLQLPQ